MKEKYRKILGITVILTVLIVKLFSERINQILWNDKAAPHFYWSITGQILYYLIPVLIVLFIFHKPQKAFSELGLNNGFLKGLLMALIFTLPMLIGYYLLGHYNNEYSLIKNISFAFKDGFREEIFYRAFLFGQLFRQVKLGFIPAVAINGLIFGISHLYQAHNIGESVGVFAITFAGAIWFAWLFIEWDDNIWLPICMHTLMNLYWDLFSTDKTAMGGLLLNLPRILTIAISIYITIKMRKKHFGSLRIDRKNLFQQVINQ
jgi:membrane protease YdiL (CAAX protease family)